MQRKNFYTRREKGEYSEIEIQVDKSVLGKVTRFRQLEREEVTT